MLLAIEVALAENMEVVEPHRLTEEELAYKLILEKSKMPKKFDNDTLDKSIPPELLLKKHSITALPDNINVSATITAAEWPPYVDRYYYRTSNLIGIENRKYIVRESGDRQYANIYTETEAYMSDVWAVEWGIGKSPTKAFVFVAYYETSQSPVTWLYTKSIPADHVYWFIIERDPPYLVISIFDDTTNTWLYQIYTKILV